VPSRSKKKTSSSPLSDALTRFRSRAEQVLDAWLPPAATHPARLHEAMRYAVLNGGKRIRPVLVYATGQALGVPQERLDAPACAVELIHAYSLVHDDLPAMDDDDLRRGQPTCHKAYDEATAILVGDALQTLAFYVLAHAPLEGVEPTARLRMVGTLSLAAGSRGMVGGQAIDLAAVGQQLDVAQLEDMHIHKTGALIRASVLLGALSAADVDMPRFEALDRYAKCIGLAFQIQDDILDVAGDVGETGKAIGADASRNKPTYPAILGMDEAKQLASDLIETALKSLEGFDERADVLRGIAEYVVNRRN
jgi:geranylgeranyl pyrophosphate synthase